jgi:glycosyltransferase involved in cell wall biosynthesis
VFVVAHNASPIFGGGEIWTALLLAGLQRRGHRTLLLCRSPDIAARAARHGIETRVLRLGGDAMLPHALRFAWTLRRLRADALLLTTFKKIWLGGLGARLAGVPRVLGRVAISTALPRNATYRIALRRWLDALVVNAEPIRQSFLAALPELDPRRVITLHDGVLRPETSAARGAVRQELGLPPEALLIGTLARLAVQKRLDRLLHALSALPADVHCLVAGEGLEREALLELATRLGVRGRLHLTGFRTDAGDVLDALDVFVLSSDVEGMANAMLEAMALGVPVVSTPVSGAAEALDPFADGTAPGVIAGFDAAELAAATGRLLAEPALRRRMGEAGVRRVAERFDFERMLDRWERLLAGTAAAGAPREQEPAGQEVRR